MKMTSLFISDYKYPTTLAIYLHRTLRLTLNRGSFTILILKLGPEGQVKRNFHYFVFDT